MTAHTKKSGSWTTVDDIHVKRSGSWATTKVGYVKRSGTWTQFHPNAWVKTYIFDDGGLHATQAHEYFNLTADGYTDSSKPFIVYIEIKNSTTVMLPTISPIYTGVSYLHLYIESGSMLVGEPGRGGNGGAGITGYTGANGSRGGSGLDTYPGGTKRVQCYIENYGTISGGGGGGGGGGGTSGSGAGGGGGGGAGPVVYLDNSFSTLVNYGGLNISTGVRGANGNMSGGGSGGSGSSGGVSGGDGGAIGTAGNPGGYDGSHLQASGGAAGPSVRIETGYITWINKGTLVGPESYY